MDIFYGSKLIMHYIKTTKINESSNKVVYN